ncbi:S8 family serine peptidase [Niveibacterium sp. 24ML]|uniref:S8 family serine peptidase n=1 Tax=Niveibacterium sp. 24ML TaxID=2985512 RepID=UPI00226E08A5|nr:S8 family serine peptidase [Niveibacterium sp. 24ML]MCX9157781.1 S8 family serine peptidase [Niveibacterium sp. 24ML]
MVVPSGLITEGDTNDTQSPLRANDTPATAEPIPNPGIVVGFGSALPTGVVGDRFEKTADEWDSFKVSLAAGQIVALEVSKWDAVQPGRNDLDLFLFDSNLKLVASSEGVEQYEGFYVPADGNYFVVVRTMHGASTYQLFVASADQVSAQAAAMGLNRFGDFVPGEAVVTVQPVAQAKVVGMTLDRVAANDRPISGATVVAGQANRAMRVQFARAAAKAVGAESAEREPWSGHVMSSEESVRAETIRQIKALRASSDVRSASPNYRVSANAVPNDPLYKLQWHYPLINLPEAWNITDGSRGGAPVVVAVVDSGVVVTHPDLAGQLVAGFDFVSDTRASRDGDGIDADASDPGDLAHGGRTSSFHGTHVAGTIVAKTNNALGVAGVAGGARVMPVRVLGAGGQGTTYDILQGFRFAAGLANDSGRVPAQRADIVNMSLGGPGAVQAFQDAITDARAQGVIVVAAAGNEHSDRPSFPASYSGVISVSAVVPDRSLAEYSNFGPRITVAAPGGSQYLDENADGRPDQVISTVGVDTGGAPGWTYEAMPGTSMASPHVAGVIALMRAVNPGLTPAQIDQLLATGAMTDDIGPSGRDDQFGFGLINAYKSVLAAQNLVVATPAAPVLSSSEKLLSFGAARVQMSFELRNIGGGALSVTSVTSNVPWVSVAPSSVDANRLGLYSVTIDRAKLPVGAHRAVITVTGATDVISVPVSVVVSAGAFPGNAGLMTVMLVDPLTQKRLYGTAMLSTNGSYAFSMSGIAPGAYVLLAGNDPNASGYICELGELCGVWPLKASPQLISVSSNLTGLNFAVLPDDTSISKIWSAAVQSTSPFERVIQAARASMH